MDAIIEDTQLPTAIDAQPVVRAAAAMRPKLLDYKHQVETEQRLPLELVEEFRAAGFYSLVMPRSMGGLQADPLTYQRVVELLAEGLGSAGWNVANNGVGQLITLGYPDEGVREIYANGPDTILAGTAVPGGGTAVPVDGGYRVTGRWSFGSGCQEAAWMTGSFAIPDRSPGYWRGTFAKHEVTVVPGSWEVTGMRGTGSFDWTVEDLFVPERRVMVHVGAPLDNQWAHWPGITYAMPSFAWVGPHHCSVLTGIARAGIDALIELAGGKVPRGRASSALLCDSAQVQEAVGRADSMLNAGRIYRAAMIRELWDTVASGEETTLEQRARCRLAATFAADCAREAMDMMYRLGGSTSFKQESRLAECWRDLHVVGQTANIAPEWYPLGGRVLMGMDPGPRLR
jgi:alkylation response protein AidB-like acyl-CoA dehydrogenase